VGCGKILVVEESQACRDSGGRDLLRCGVLLVVQGRKDRERESVGGGRGETCFWTSAPQVMSLRS